PFAETLATSGPGHGEARVGRALRVRIGEEACHFEPSSVPVLEADLAPLRLDDLAAEREAQPRTPRLRGVERQERVLQHLVAHPRAAVAHRQLEAPVRAPHVYGDLTFRA